MRASARWPVAGQVEAEDPGGTRDVATVEVRNQPAGRAQESRLPEPERLESTTSSPGSIRRSTSRNAGPDPPASTRSR